MKTLTNTALSIAVKEDGAELCSLRSASGCEYLWSADPAYWKRHAPVLFPIVGSVWQGAYRSHGRTYHLSQHGFARDMRFALISETQDELWYRLSSSDETLEKYPYAFRLEVGYRLLENGVRVMWRVSNPGNEEMAYQIGAHPAFFWPEGREGDVLGYFHFDTQAPTLTRSTLEQGCVAGEATVHLEEGGYLPLTYELFSGDALVLEHDQVHEVTLCDAARHPYLKVTFSSPLVGLWSPPGKEAPFVCIEPWWGRTDRAHYAGDFEHREWMQHLAPGATAEYHYDILIP